MEEELSVAKRIIDSQDAEAAKLSTRVKELEASNHRLQEEIQAPTKALADLTEELSQDHAKLQDKVNYLQAFGRKKMLNQSSI